MKHSKSNITIVPTINLIVDNINKSKYLTSEEISKKLGKSHSTTRQILIELIREGKIHRIRLSKSDDFSTTYNYYYIWKEVEKQFDIKTVYTLKR
jgi:transcription initiation factor IIE alpha subunit